MCSGDGAFSPELAAVKHGERRVRRLVMGESTRRSSGLDAEHLTAILRQQGAEQLAGSAELTLVLNGMELRREGATAQEHLMQVKDLDGALVNGYRSFNVLQDRDGPQAQAALPRPVQQPGAGFQE
ncbi:MAG: hypothetical protein U0X20_02040 [Caldilineaceae bacterium]